MNKAILSYPYSGALQQFFATELMGDSWGKDHGYYKTLWGKNYDQIKTVALSFFTIYDEIIFSPVDNPLPDFSTYMKTDEYYHPDFGLRMPARPSELGFEYGDNAYVEWALTDPVISKVLVKVPNNARHQILFQVLCDMELSFRHKAEIISSSGRRLIMKRLTQIDGQYHNLNGRIVELDKPVAHFTNLVIPDFDVSSIDLLHKVKMDKKIRKYGKSFVSVLKDISPDISELEFRKIALESDIRNARNESINGYCSLASKITSALGFIPVVGPFFSAGSLLVGESERVTNFSNNDWLEIKPRLVKIITRHELEKSQKN